MKINTLDLISRILVIIGAVNWGLFGAAGIDLVSYLPALLAKIVYIVVGLAGLYEIYALTKK